MIYFLIPVYNEEANIANLANELLPALTGEPRFFVFSDDGSTDASHEKIKTHFSSADHIILGDGKNGGPGVAFNRGFEWILQHSTNDNDRIVTLEADCTSDINILPKMMEHSWGGTDLVLASVYAPGGGFDETSFMRKLFSSVANGMFRIVFRVKQLTLSSFYRVYTVALLREIKKKKKVLIKEKGFLCMFEILHKSVKVDAKIVEVPMVLHSKKRVGKSKMKVIKTSFSYLRYLLIR